jgi:hypothetical protein
MVVGHIRLLPSELEPWANHASLMQHAALWLAKLVYRLVSKFVLNIELRTLQDPSCANVPAQVYRNELWSGSNPHQRVPIGRCASWTSSGDPHDGVRPKAKVKHISFQSARAELLWTLKDTFCSYVLGWIVQIMNDILTWKQIKIILVGGIVGSLRNKKPMDCDIRGRSSSSWQKQSAAIVATSGTNQI